MMKSDKLISKIFFTFLLDCFQSDFHDNEIQGKKKSKIVDYINKG